MSMHPVKNAGLSSEHVKAFDQLATNDYHDGIDEQLLKDLQAKYLIEKDEIGNYRIPMVVYAEWADSND